ncbi:MAG: hypothetical protein AB7S26_41580 [Sandaracinaceae bacterium]
MVGLVLVGALGAWGCRRHGASTTGALTARQERNLLHLASRDTRCPANQLQVILLQPGTPAIYSVQGCQPVEYSLHCRGRRCNWRRIDQLEMTAGANLQCPPQMIQQSMTQTPVTRYATGCGRQAPYTVSCNAMACGWTMSGPVEGASAAVAQQGGGVVVQPAGPTSDANGANLQARLLSQRDAILSCLDDAGELVLTVRWTAQGQVMLQIPPELANTAAEGCIQAAVGALSVPAQSQPGQVSITVQ